MNCCKTCLTVIENDNPIFYLSDIYMDPTSFTSDIISIKDKLVDCVPELLLDPANNAVICKLCVTSLMAAYNFRQRCLAVHRQTHSNLQQMPVNTEINSGQTAMLYKGLAVVKQEGNPSISVVDGGNNKPNMDHDVGISSTVPSNLPHNTTEISIKEEPSKEMMRLAKTADLKRKFKCDTCNYECVAQFLLKRHSRVHRNKYRVVCPQCTFRCKTAHDLTAHMQTKHKRADEHGSSFNLEDEMNHVAGQNTVAQEKPNESKYAKKRKRIKKQKQIVAQMQPILVITPQ